MSNSSPAPALLDDALRALARKGNPFRQQFARNSDDPVCSLYHVAGIFEQERAVLQELVESYRGEQARPTCVLPLLGARGAGKTHLLHNLKHGPGVPPQLFVTPGTFRVDAGGRDSSFLEYVLYQFINVLLAGAEQRGVRPLIYIGEHLTRQTLLEALEKSGENQPTTAPTGIRKLSWPLGGGRNPGASFANLAERLRMEPRPCRAIVKEAGFDPERLAALTHELLETKEARDLKGEYRKRMIAGFVRATLLGEDAELADFLTDGFADVKFLVKPTRSQLTLSLLQAMTELIVGAGIPVAVAFDQLEELLYGQTDDDIRRASDAFFGGIVQLMSQVPSFCVLLFVEEGLWNRIVPPLPSHILDRIHEPIHLPSHGTIRTVRLKTPTVDQLTEVVYCRVRRTLADYPHADQLPPEFPFDREYLGGLAKRETVLRLMLQGCCNRLDEMFEGLGSPSQEAAPIAPRPTEPVNDDRLWQDLRDRWSQEVRVAERKLKPVGSLAGATGEVHGGLARWLHVCKMLGVEQEEWRMTGIRDLLQVGDHPSYGALTVVEWSNAANEIRSVGIGLWLGRGVGKPRDLEVKLSVFAQPEPPIDHLILFRPADDARLSGRSLQAWDGATAAGHSLRLESVDLEIFAKLHAFPRWMQQIHDAYTDGETPERVFVFLAEQTEVIMLRLGLPADAVAEPAAA